jgi:hypothetical protein
MTDVVSDSYKVPYTALYQLQKRFSTKEYMRWITYGKIGYEGKRGLKTIVRYYDGFHLEGPRQIMENLPMDTQHFEN